MTQKTGSGLTLAAILGLAGISWSLPDVRRKEGFSDVGIRVRNIEPRELSARIARFYDQRPRPWRSASCHSSRPLRYRTELERLRGTDLIRVRRVVDRANSAQSRPAPRHSIVQYVFAICRRALSR